MLETIRDHWRITLLVVVILGATVTLFAPQFAPDEKISGQQAGEGLTNLQYGLDLAGGTRIRAPLLGHTAENAAIGDADVGQVATAVAGELPETSVTDVNVELRPTREEDSRPADIEVTNAEVSRDQFETALSQAGYDEYDQIRQGVTEETREAAVNVVQGKVDEAGLSGGSARQVRDEVSGQHFILVEVPGEGRQDVIDLLEQRGTVRIDIYYPDGSAEDGYSRDRGVLTSDDFDNIGTAARDEQSRPYVPLSVVNTETNPGAAQFEDAAANRGVAQPGGSTCTYSQEPVGETRDPCLLLVVNDEVINAFGMQPSLARSMMNGEWSLDPQFRLTTNSFTEAQTVSVSLRAGALPAQLAIDQGSTSFISPAQGDDFQTLSLLTGVIAVFGVAGMVFLRYRQLEVAVPMIVTGLSEVFALLGFASLLGYPIDLAVIAGFIAVVGTGVDDLIIIADEVMSQGEVSSRKVFDSRFRKAFWVIGAAAATTILAMSPLMVLSLGDLSGFAIFTILGVLVGVLITRPAYGDILRTLLTDR